MTRVKICGLTRAADAETALDAGADALGFVFAKSPRQVPPDLVRSIVADLPPLVATIGVFVDAPPDDVRRVLDECGLSGAQLHGSESEEDIRAVGAGRVIKAFRICHSAELESVRDCPAGLVLIEPYVAGKLG
ncbi:MAG TPA: N-(5'-phosphoribosyl)anthranilate isomerase, partial [Armatimonadota bacterium]|nr:N-(5'-phosphoribosyl)anthranilate isomerase [Armatimonadota bacterium]